MFSVHTIATPSLGDHSYLAHDGEVALVVDPQRDIDRVLRLADELEVRITHVAETHIHNDYLSGGLELARQTGAAYLVDARDEVGFVRTPVRDDEEVPVGAMRVRPMATPGHTPHHLSYALADQAGTVHGVFSGGSLLDGTTGRTDLVPDADTVELTRAQYRSVRRLATDLAADVALSHTHGFGSFCSAAPSAGTASTIGDQLGVNPALTRTEQDFVDTLIAGLGPWPAYYRRMGPGNTAGAGPVDHSPPHDVAPSELRRRLERGLADGQWVVDLRAGSTFAADHLVGSLNVPLARPFVTYLGWLLPHDAELTLIAEHPEQVVQARRELARIGIDRLAGAATGPVDALAHGHRRASYRVSDFAGLTARDPAAAAVVDVRTDQEHREGGLPAAIHIPLPELRARSAELPARVLWIHCRTGYRASVAASLLAADSATAREVVLVDDDWDRAAVSCLPVAIAPASARPDTPSSAGRVG